jgi:hypothetical protein
VLDLFGETRELREQNCALPFCHPVVRAHQRTLEGVSRAAPPAVDERLASLFQLRIVDQDHSAFAGGHRLAALKAEASDRAVRADSATSPLRARHVRTILDYRDGIRARDFQQSIEIGQRCAVVHRHDCLGAPADEPRHRGRVDACVDRTDVREDGTRHACDDCIRRCGECERGHDYFISWSDAERFERDF